MKGDESEPDCARDEAKEKSIFWYADNIDNEVTPEVYDCCSLIPSQ